MRVLVIGGGRVPSRFFVGPGGASVASQLSPLAGTLFYLAALMLQVPAAAIFKQMRQWRSEIASKTLPNLVNTLIQRAESGVNASVVKAE
jgi:hypothetical protein